MDAENFEIAGLVKSNRPITIDSIPLWVEESRFGRWFLDTDTWIQYVLNVAIDDLERLIEHRCDGYPLIVDIGCGYGHAFQPLDTRFNPDKIVGIDTDLEVLSRATNKVSDCRCEVHLINGASESIELPDKSVDLVFCHQSFHHFVDQEAAIREFFRILKPGGILMLAESCRKYIHSFLIRLLFRHPMQNQRMAFQYLRMIRRSGFVFEKKNVSFPNLWWSRADLGLMQRLGLSGQGPREETLVNLVARRPLVD